MKEYEAIQIVEQYGRWNSLNPASSAYSLRYPASSTLSLFADSPRGLVRKLLDRENRCRGFGNKRGPSCCSRAGEYNGYGSDGPTTFTCPQGCSCHD